MNRLAVIIAVVVAALVALQPGNAARATPGSVDELTLEQQVGQLLILRFRGETSPDYVRRALRERRVAGVILFGNNISSPAQLRDLTRALRRAGGSPSPLVAVDQEGGSVRRIPWAPPAPAQAEQVAEGTVRRRFRTPRSRRARSRATRPS